MMSANTNTPYDPAQPKGIALIAAYREGRLRPGGAVPGPAPSSRPGEPAEGAARPREPSLAEIGFGPGMSIRLGQLGVHDIGDLAAADAARLRVALGDISRLIDVEAWINSARQMVRTMSAGR